MHTPLTRIPIPRVAPHPVSGMVNAAASISSLTQHFLIILQLVHLRFKIPFAPVAISAQQTSKCQHYLSKRQ